MTPLKKVISAEKGCYMLCARSVHTTYGTQFLSTAFVQGSQYGSNSFGESGVRTDLPNA